MIGRESLPRHGAMFGMQDPSQTLVQIERYMDGGRLELSEVMATQFCDLMLSKKKREPQDQVFLLKGLRLMCDIYLMRNKADQSLVTIKRMHRERKALVKLLQKHAPNMLASMQPEEEDHLRAGRLYAAAGKAKAAKNPLRCVNDFLLATFWPHCTALGLLPQSPISNASSARFKQQEMSFLRTVNSNFNPRALLR